MSLLCLGMIDRANLSPPLILFGGGLALFMGEGGFDGYRCIRIFCIGGLTNGSIQFILKKERERLISRSYHKVIFLRLIVFTEIFSQSRRCGSVLQSENSVLVCCTQSDMKIKPCKRNNRQNSDHTKDAAKEGKNSAS